MNKREQEFPIGSIVYYIIKNGHNWDIKWGLVDEHYVNALCIQTVHIKDTRLINGIPYNDFAPDERRHKLPKGWTYDTELYELTYDNTNMDIPYNISDKDLLLRCYNNGYFINTQEYDFSHIEEDVTKDGYKLVKKFYPYERAPIGIISCPYNECFVDYSDALTYVHNHDQEILRQTQLTDEEWALEEINKTLDRAIQLNIINEPRRNEIYDLLIKEDVVNIETRIFMGHVQWKLCKNKKWVTFA